MVNKEHITCWRALNTPRNPRILESLLCVGCHSLAHKFLNHVNLSQIESSVPSYYVIGKLIVYKFMLQGISLQQSVYYKHQLICGVHWHVAQLCFLLSKKRFCTYKNNFVNVAMAVPLSCLVAQGGLICACAVNINLLNCSKSVNSNRCHWGQGEEKPGYEGSWVDIELCHFWMAYIATPSSQNCRPFVSVGAGSESAVVL